MKKKKHKKQIKKYNVRSVGGYHFLYADTFLTREEFEEMFDITAYQLVRKKYHAEGRIGNLKKSD